MISAEGGVLDITLLLRRRAYEIGEPKIETLSGVPEIAHHFIVLASVNDLHDLRRFDFSPPAPDEALPKVMFGISAHGLFRVAEIVHHFIIPTAVDNRQRLRRFNSFPPTPDDTLSEVVRGITFRFSNSGERLS